MFHIHLLSRFLSRKIQPLQQCLVLNYSKMPRLAPGVWCVETRFQHRS